MALWQLLCSPLFFYSASLYLLKVLKGNTSSALPPPEPEKHSDSRAKQECQVRLKAAPEEVFFATKAAYLVLLSEPSLFIVTGPAACRYLSA